MPSKAALEKIAFHGLTASVQNIEAIQRALNELTTAAASKNYQGARTAAHAIATRAITLQEQLERAEARTREDQTEPYARNDMSLAAREYRMGLLIGVGTHPQAEPAPTVHTCPKDSAELSEQISGCGATFTATPDSEGLIDCPECGLFFRVQATAPRIVSEDEHPTEADIEAYFRGEIETRPAAAMLTHGPDTEELLSPEERGVLASLSQQGLETMVAAVIGIMPSDQAIKALVTEYPEAEKAGQLVEAANAKFGPVLAIRKHKNGGHVLLIHRTDTANNARAYMTTRGIVGPSGNADFAWSTYDMTETRARQDYETR